ncbi:MAG: hypothetical protein J7K36_11050 [Archaeoglobaceae archaeon]|nr:hypothetical protein [Archaeoglobaceae archaeon]
MLECVSMNPKKIEKWIVYYTNKERKKRKRKTLKSEKHLTKAARKYAKYMLKKNKLGHYVDGKTPWQRAMKYGYPTSYVGENCMLYYTKKGTPEKIVAKNMVKLWMKSPGHKGNILRSKYKHIGVGVALRWNGRNNRYVIYASQKFGRASRLDYFFKRHKILAKILG